MKRKKNNKAKLHVCVSLCTDVIFFFFSKIDEYARASAERENEGGA